MSITGDYNTLIGAGASLPALAGSHQFVVGSNQSSAYLAYAAGPAPAGLIVTAAPAGALTIVNSTTLRTGGSAGNAGDALYSGGAGQSAHWAAAPIGGSAVRFSSDTTASPLASMYTATAAGLALTLPAAPSGATTRVKNMSSGALTISGQITPLSAVAPAASIQVASGGATGLATDGTTWFQQW